MRINFFEEFPTASNLERLKLIDFKSTLFVATRSLGEFRDIEKKIGKMNKKIETAYWPVLPKSYWISPFSYNEDLKWLKEDLEKNKKSLKVLFDLEFPLLRPKLFFINLKDFFRNKTLIKNLFNEASRLKISIYTAEYPHFTRFMHKILERFGVSYPHEIHKHKKILMDYTAPWKIVLYLKDFYFKKLFYEIGNDLHIGLGCLAGGVFGSERKMPYELLENYLKYYDKMGIKEVFIFRLGGLNEKYLNIIKKFA